MSDTTVRFTRDTRNPIANYLGIALLTGVVLLLAWMQFKWLTELQVEEEARQRVALHVAATNYTEYIDSGIGPAARADQQGRFRAGCFRQRAAARHGDRTE